MDEDLSVSGAIAALENVSLDAPDADGVETQPQPEVKKKKKAAPAPAVEANDDDDVIDANLGADDGDDEDGASADASDADGDDGEGEPDNDQASADADGEDGEDGDEGEPGEPAIDPPQHLDEKQRAIFKGLPRAAQQFLADHDKRLVADYTRKTSEVANLRRAYVQRLGVLRDVKTEQEKRMEKWKKVNWVEQAQKLDPRTYAANRAKMEMEVEAYNATKARLKSGEDALLEEHDAEQSTALQKLAPELVGKKGAPLREKVIEAVLAAGVPLQDARWITASQMLFVHEALQWRAYQAEKRKQPKITARPGTKAQGKVVAPAPRNQVPSNMRVASAKKQFNSKPSRENAMAALNALPDD